MRSLASQNHGLMDCCFWEPPAILHPPSSILAALIRVHDAQEKDAVGEVIGMRNKNGWSARKTGIGGGFSGAVPYVAATAVAAAALFLFRPLPHRLYEKLGI